MNIAHLLSRSALRFSDQPAVLHGDQVLLSYGALGVRTAALAAWLRTQGGVVPGDRVVIYAANCPEYLEALHAVLWAGAVSVPVNYKLHAKELAHVLADSGARVVLASQSLAPAAREAGASEAGLLLFGTDAYRAALLHSPMEVHDRAPQDVASLFYTSGTTGRPKGVMQTHRNLLAMTACYFTDVDDIAPGDAMVYAAPMSHGAGLYNYAQVLRGARHVVPLSGGFEPAELVQLAASVGQLTLFAAPTMVHRLVEHVRATGADVAGFKTIVYGGGPMYADDLRNALATLGNRFVQIYGQGESPMTITALARVQLADRNHPRPRCARSPSCVATAPLWVPTTSKWKKPPAPARTRPAAKRWWRSRRPSSPLAARPCACPSCPTIRAWWTPPAHWRCRACPKRCSSSAAASSAWKWAPCTARWVHAWT